MQIKGCTALVTGANRGLGQAYVQALVAAGARRVYACARNPEQITGTDTVVPVRLDVTSAEQAAAAARDCPDVNLVISNAGVMFGGGSLLAEDSIEVLHRTLAVNAEGLITMARAFAPVLARNGGGTLVNMLSVLSWYIAPTAPIYCISKHAAAAVTHALRLELKKQGTQVLGVYAGPIDTDMVASLQMPKTAPTDIASRVMQGIEQGEEYIRSDARAEELWQLQQGMPQQIPKALNQ